jgi:uncharacterized delta-60 repeat protein
MASWLGLLVGAVGLAQAQVGLDPSFGDDGVVRVELAGRSATFHDLALGTGDRIVALGDAGPTNHPDTDPLVVRFLPDGSLDPAFGEHGVALVQRPGSIENMRAVVAQPDGRIVIAGGSDGDFILQRFRHDGSLDPTFGSHGTVTTDLGGSDWAASLVLLPGGSLLAGGFSVQSSYDVALARYLPNGDLDPTFGHDGLVVTDLDGGLEQAVEVLVQTDGRIVVAGSRLSPVGAEWDFLVLRYDAAGRLDPDFGQGGVTQIDFADAESPYPSYDYAYAAALQPDGRILVGGVANDGTAGHDFGLVRLEPDGSVDETFGESGRQVSDFSFAVPGSYSDFIQALTLEPDGGILAGGTILLAFDGGYGVFALARYTNDGELDSTFGNGGLLVEDMGHPSTGVFGAQRQADGRVLLTGGSGFAAVVARYGPGSCGPGSCLHGRFRVEASWRTATRSGRGHEVALTDWSGYFWFFAPDNVELVFKILDACSLPRSRGFWVFAAGLTDQEVSFTVTDVRTGESHTWHNSLGTPFAPILSVDKFHASCVD